MGREPLACKIGRLAADIKKSRKGFWLRLTRRAGNNRIMAWRKVPGANGASCDFVIGRADTRSVDHNRAAYYPTTRSLNMPYGLTGVGEHLVVADTANLHPLGFALAGLAMDEAATRLAGQRDFTVKGDNRWAAIVRDSLCWPYNVSACSDTLVVATPVIIACCCGR
jgi:hypothetical protein